MFDRFHGQAATITAKNIDVDEKPIRRRGKHKGSRITADADVSIELTKQNHLSSPSEEYPVVGTVVSGDHAVIDTRMAVGKKPSTKNGKKKLSVDRGFDAEVTGKVKRSRKEGKS